MMSLAGAVYIFCWLFQFHNIFLLSQWRREEAPALLELLYINCEVHHAVSMIHEVMSPDEANNCMHMHMMLVYILNKNKYN